MAKKYSCANFAKPAQCQARRARFAKVAKACLAPGRKGSMSACMKAGLGGGKRKKRGK